MPSEAPSPDPAGIPVDRRSSTSGQYRDLCSNCENAEEHATRGRPRRPILFCEEFEVSTAPISEQYTSVEQRPSQVDSGSGRMGLCVNCENSRTCTLPRPEGGIWHCEEYC